MLKTGNMHALHDDNDLLKSKLKKKCQNPLRYREYVPNMMCHKKLRGEQSKLYELKETKTVRIRMNWT